MKKQGSVKIIGSGVSDRVNRKTLKYGVRHLKTSAVVALVLMVLTITTAIPPPVYVTLGEGRYISLGEQSDGDYEWIAAGSAEDYLAGRFFKIDTTSHTSGRPAADFEVRPSGFPISCAFAEEVWKGEFGVYALNPLMILIDYVIWLFVVLVIVSYLDSRKGIGKKITRKSR